MVMIIIVGVAALIIGGFIGFLIRGLIIDEVDKTENNFLKLGKLLNYKRGLINRSYKVSNSSLKETNIDVIIEVFAVENMNNKCKVQVIDVKSNMSNVQINLDQIVSMVNNSWVSEDEIEFLEVSIYEKRSNTINKILNQ